MATDRLIGHAPAGFRPCDQLATAVAGIGTALDRPSAPTQDHGFMYGRSVEDPDGNVWEILLMDAAAHAQTGESA